MKKTVGIITIIIVMLIILTGCSVNLDYEVKINKDGSGDISYVYGFSKDALENLQTTPENLLKSKTERAMQNEYLVEEYEDDEFSGFKATKHVNDLAKEFSLKEAFGDEYVNEDKNENKKGLLINKTFFKIRIEQNTEVNLTSMEDIASVTKIKYTVNLPVKAKSSNATKVSNDGKTLTWDLIPGEINNIQFISSGFNICTIIIIVISIAVIVAIVIFVFIFFKRKKVTK